MAIDVLDGSGIVAETAADAGPDQEVNAEEVVAADAALAAEFAAGSSQLVSVAAAAFEGSVIAGSHAMARVMAQ